MSTRLCLALAVFAGFGLVACQKPATSGASSAPELTTDDQKSIYTLGIAMARNLEPFNLSEEELKILEQGLDDGSMHRTPKVDFETQAPKISAFAKERAAATAKAEEQAGEGFLAAAGSEPGAQKFDSGLVLKEITPGTGDSPKATDTVKVNYEGKLRDGTVFDSSLQRGPFQVTLSRVIPCWSEGLQKMKVGGKAKLTCPAKIAYGERGYPPKIKPGATLAFEVELVEIVPATEMPPGHPMVPGMPPSNAPGAPQSNAAGPNAQTGKAPGAPATPPAPKQP
jgi:FKBP-type peptidyl-prolyl cis-trans isomerase